MSALPPGKALGLGACGVDLECAPELDQVSSIREFIESYYQLVLGDPELISRIAIAAHELLENATKYSSRGGSRLRIEIKGGAAPRKISVSVSNVADPARLEELKGTISELGKTDDAAELYQDYIERAAKRDEGSGLGLARIRAEAEMSLVLELEGDEVCVKAETPLQPEEKP
ncbi:MAG TPA: ATP-binding protein [Polyangia bacterium]|nr:ATP-binding protein [Polyangia bacterium]